MTDLDNWTLMERLARDRGVNEHTMRKWRQRGVPYRWRLLLLQDSKGQLDTAAMDRISPIRKSA